jgi:hypothetical protein
MQKPFESQFPDCECLAGLRFNSMRNFGILQNGCAQCSVKVIIDDEYKIWKPQSQFLSNLVRILFWSSLKWLWTIFNQIHH